MRHKDIVKMALAAGPVILAGTTAVAADDAKVDEAFETLKTYDWGADRNALNPIDEAVVATYGDADARLALEKRLAAVLATDASRSAKDFVCRKLRTVGTAESVPALAGLLSDEELSHMSRYALERIPAPEAAAALRDALPKVKGDLKIGVIGSLGSRRDAGSVSALAALLKDSDAAVALAAANSLAAIGTPEAGKALSGAAKAAPDACLACAEVLLADGKKAEALALYKLLNSPDQPQSIRVAATRGILAVARK